MPITWLANPGTSPQTCRWACMRPYVPPANYVPPPPPTRAETIDMFVKYLWMNTAKDDEYMTKAEIKAYLRSMRASQEKGV